MEAVRQLAGVSSSSAAAAAGHHTPLLHPSRRSRSRGTPSPHSHCHHSPWSTPHRPSRFPSSAIITCHSTTTASTSGGSSSKWADRLVGDFQFTSSPHLEQPSSSSSNTVFSVLPPPPPPAAPDRTVTLPIDFYQVCVPFLCPHFLRKVLAAETHFLSDGIRRAFEARVSKPPQYGFSQDALLARRQILQAACDTLSSPSSRGDYNQAFVDDPDTALVTHVPWDKVPGALCVLQEAGETEVVLKVGRKLLSERLPKPFKCDVVLAMVLAYVDASRDAMALSPPDFIVSCDALGRALKLLQEEGASNLAPDLQAQIDETLEEITPRCVLELLASPLDEEHWNRREEGLQGVRNILWAVGGGGAAAVGRGFTREGFMNEAFLCMTASEQVNLFSDTPSNVPAESFEVYGVALALVAKAYVGKKPHLVKVADNHFRQLQHTKVTALGSVSDFNIRADREIDYALERSLCSLLLGEIGQCHLWLGIDDEGSLYRDPSIVEFIVENSKDDQDNNLLPGLCKLLEAWFMEVVFPRFRDTQHIQFRLGDYYDDPTVLRYLESLEGGGSSPLAAAAAMARIGAEAKAALGSVKSSAIQALQKVFPLGDRKQKMDEVHYDRKSDLGSELQTEGFAKKSDGDNSSVLGEASENANFKDSSNQDMTSKVKDVSVKVMCAGVAVGLLTLAGLKFLPSRNGSPLAQKDVGSAMAADVANLDLLSNENSVEEILKMDAILAESLVRHWQDIKSQALGPEHRLEKLPEVLEGQMLKEWTDRAAEIAQRGWFWEYDLIGLAIDSVTVSVDGNRGMVEVTLEEVAKLTDPAHPEHDDSCSTRYAVRYEMSCTKSGWRIMEGAVLKS